MAWTVQFSEYGGTDVLRVVDASDLSAGPGQVRVAVRAAGINPIDSKILHGFMAEVMPLTLPAGLGSDLAGVVDEVGAGVTEFELGDEVLGSSLTPTLSESTLADPANLVIKPPDISWEVAGGVTGAGGTAWTVLNKLGIRAGETLLIHAAAGGVGTFAVQLAVLRGACDRYGERAQFRVSEIDRCRTRQLRRRTARTHQSHCTERSRRRP